MSDLLPVLEVLEDTGVWGSASASKEMKMKRSVIIMRELTTWNMGPLVPLSSRQMVVWVVSVEHFTKDYQR